MLFNTISQVISSAAVVQRAVSLLCPLNGFLPPHFTYALDQFLNMFQNSYKEPPPLIPLCDLSNTYQETLSTNIDQTLTFTFWLKIDTFNKNYYPIILQATDNSSQNNLYKFTIYANNSLLTLTDGTSSYQSNNCLLEKRWNFIALTFQKSEKPTIAKHSGTLSIFTNGESAGHIELNDKMNILTNNSITYSFGGLMNQLLMRFLP